MLILGALMSAIFEVVGILYSFCEFSGKQKQKTKNHTTFMNSSWGIFERNMRVVIIWTMSHLLLGHEKKALLNLKQQIIFVSNASDSFIKYEPSLVRALFLHVID